MSTIQFPKAKYESPDFEVISAAFASIRRTVPAVADSDYKSLYERLALARTDVEETDISLKDALGQLPVALSDMSSVEGIIAGLQQIEQGVKEGKLKKDDAAAARAELQKQLAASASKILDAFRNAANKLSSPADSLSASAKTLDKRLQEAFSTEKANAERAGVDVKRESERLESLQKRLKDLDAAVDKARGKPLDELMSIIPDGKELSSLLDLGGAQAAEAAAAPELAAAKKAVEFAVTQLKKALEAVGKTIEFEQVKEVRDELAKTVNAQSKVVEAAQSSLERANVAVGKLDAVQRARSLMTSLVVEIKKMSVAFSTFASQLADLSGQSVTVGVLNDLVSGMSAYLNLTRAAYNSIVVS